MEDIQTLFNRCEQIIEDRLNELKIPFTMNIERGVMPDLDDTDFPGVYNAVVPFYGEHEFIFNINPYTVDNRLYMPAHLSAKDFEYKTEENDSEAYIRYIDAVMYVDALDETADLAREPDMKEYIRNRIDTILNYVKQQANTPLADVTRNRVDRELAIFREHAVVTGGDNGDATANMVMHLTTADIEFDPVKYLLTDEETNTLESAYLFGADTAWAIKCYAKSLLR